MKNNYDVVIVGAGPAGLRCAEILAKNGKKVIVLEKNKIVGSKVCAGGLTLKDLDLGIPAKIIQRKFKKLIVHTPFDKTEIKFEKPFIATIKREDLGRWMLSKSRKWGAEVKTCSEVTSMTKKYVIVNKKTKLFYKFLVGADGSNSIVRKSLGLKTEKFLQAFQYLPKRKFEDVELFLDSKKFGHYVWIFPYKTGASVGTGGDLKKNKMQLNFSTKEIKSNFDCLCSKKFRIKQCKFESATINYDYRGYEFSNIFLVGDAGGFASGLTGEGIYSAIKSGEEVAQKILNKNYNCPNIDHILKVKEFEEFFLKSMEKNKLLSSAEFEIFNLLLKVKFVDSELLKLLKW